MIRPLLAFLLAAGLLLSAPPRALAQSDPSDVIGAQIEAFRADDFATAFTYAAPGIKRLFGSPENFGRMVRQGYPMVWRPADIRYGARETRGARVLQQVIITDAAGQLHMLLYEMVPAADGWQIGGVQILQMPNVGT